MANKDYKQNLKQVKKIIEIGGVDGEKAENALRKIIGKPLPKKEIFKKYPQLEKFYNSIGDNPIDEPELDFNIDDMSKTYFADFYIETLKCKKELVVADDVPLETLKLFSIEVANKVKGFEIDGVLKKIEKFNSIDFKNLELNSIEIAKIIKKYDDATSPIRDEINTALDLMLDGYDPDIDDPNEFELERKKLIRDFKSKEDELKKNQTEEIDAKLYSILNIKKDYFTEWEYSLFKLNCMAMLGYNSYTSFIKEEL